MKKKIITIIFSSIVIISLFITYDIFFKRTPEKILLSQFGISLKGYNYSTISKNEQWDYNGDGYCLIIFDFSNFSVHDFKNFINKDFIKLPIRNMLESNEIPKSYLKSQNGYYILQKEKDNIRNFKVFIINTDTKKAVLYYQVM